MQRLVVAFLFWSGLILSADGLSEEIPVTPDHLDQDGLVFSVSTNAAPAGIAFHITMTGKTSDIDTNYSDAGLGVVTHTAVHSKAGDGVEGSGGPLLPAVPVKLKKEKRVWTADFVVSGDSLKNPDLYFDFSFEVHAIWNGKDVPMPSITEYQIRLEDFIGQISKALNGRWCAESGDSYEFTDDGKYEHWLPDPAVSKSVQADALNPSNRTGVVRGTFSIDGNILALKQNTGSGQNELFYYTKCGVDEAAGAHYGTRDSFIIISTNGSVTKYELKSR